MYLSFSVEDPRVKKSLSKEFDESESSGVDMETRYDLIKDYEFN